MPVTFDTEPRFTGVVPAAGAITVRPNVAVWLKLPDVPVTVIVTAPAVAELFAVRVSTLVLVVFDGLNAAVTPVGNPEAARLTEPLKPFSRATDTVVVTLALLCVVRDPPDSVRLKFGATMVRVRVAVALRAPEVPVTVMVEVPATAALPAVRVIVLALFVLEGLKAAVTPAGSPEATRLTLPLKPSCGTTVIVLLPALPGVTVKLGADAVRL
jgi:hypothetical protein